MKVESENSLPFLVKLRQIIPNPQNQLKTSYAVIPCQLKTFCLYHCSRAGSQVVYGAKD
jgi:hypothetical protein